MMTQERAIKKTLDVGQCTKRWNAQPEGQDLQENRVLRRWMTADSRGEGKKAWKGKSRK